MSLDEKVAEGQMKTYTGTKTIKAVETTKAEYLEYRGWNLPDGEDPEEVIYLVEYAPDPKSTPNHKNHEGYISMSPKHVFDEAYKQSGELTFGMAVEAMKNGEKAARSGWNGKGMYAVVMPGYPKGIEVNEITRKAHNLPEGTKLIYRPYFQLYTAQNDVAMWSPSGSDALAEDWIILK